MNATITINNPTKYINKTTKTKFTLTNPNIFSLNKQKDYETRLYYEWKKVLKCNGNVYCGCLTYADKNLKKFYGIPVTDTNDIKNNFGVSSKWYKNIVKHYATMPKIICVSELGEGGVTHNYKGKRGAHNNPHWHFQLFTYKMTNDEIIEWNTKNKRNKIINPKKLTEQILKDSIELIWQGFTGTKFIKCKYHSNYGNVDWGGEAQSLNSFTYITKYVDKDLNYKRVQTDLEQRIYATKRNELEQIIKPTEKFIINNIVYTANEYIDLKANEFKHEEMKKWRNQYGHKIVKWQKMGELGIEDMMKNPLKNIIHINTKTELNKEVKPSLHYYRLVYQKRVPMLDNFGEQLYSPTTGQKLYKYEDNELCKQMKLSNYEKDITKTKNNAKEIFDIYKNNNTLVSKFYYEYKDKIVNIENLTDQLFEEHDDKTYFMYAIYKKTYENRVINDNWINIKINHKKHYEETLKKTTNNDYVWNKTNSTYNTILQKYNITKNTYEYHSTFMPYNEMFKLLDLLTDFHRYMHSKRLEEKDREYKELKLAQRNLCM